MITITYFGTINGKTKYHTQKSTLDSFVTFNDFNIWCKSHF